MQDSIQTIFKSARHFFSGTLFSRLTGFFRDITTAYVFGVSPSVAAFMVAFRFSHLLRRVLGEGALQGAFTPQFENLRIQDPKAAAHFFSQVNTLLTTFLCAIVIFSMFFLEGIIGFFSIDNKEIVSLITLLMPGLIFICLYGLNSALLQCQKKYFLSSFAPSILNLGWIAAVLSLSSFSAENAMPWLALSVVFATMAQWLVTVPGCYRALRSLDPSASWLTKKINMSHIKALLGPIAISTIGIAATQINTACDAIFARYADLEGPAYLWYAIRIQQLPLALFGIALASALLPPLSRAAKAGNSKLFHHFLRTAWRSTLGLMLPISAIIFLWGEQILSMIYGHGHFDLEAVQMTQFCLEGYTLGLIPMALLICHVQGCYAQGNYKAPMYASLISITTNCILNSWFVMGLGYGAASVAVATGISAWIQLAILYFISKKRAAESLQPKSYGYEL